MNTEWATVVIGAFGLISSVDFCVGPGGFEPIEMIGYVEQLVLLEDEPAMRVVEVRQLEPGSGGSGCGSQDNACRFGFTVVLDNSPSRIVYVESDCLLRAGSYWAGDWNDDGYLEVDIDVPFHGQSGWCFAGITEAGLRTPGHSVLSRDYERP